MSTITDTIATLSEDVMSVLGRFEDAIRKSGDVLRKLDKSQRTAYVRMGRLLGRAEEAAMLLAPKPPEARKAHVAAFWATLCEWAGEKPGTGNPYSVDDLKGFIKAARVIDRIGDKGIAEALGVDAAKALASIPEEHRDSFLVEHIADGGSLAPKPLREARNEWLYDNEYRERPTLKGRTQTLVSKWKDEDETTAARDAVANLHGRTFNPVKQDSILVLVRYVLRVNGLDGNSTAYRVTSEAIAQLLQPGGRDGRRPNDSSDQTDQRPSQLGRS
jgi:hypothetical protein